MVVIYYNNDSTWLKKDCRVVFVDNVEEYSTLSELCDYILSYYHDKEETATSYKHCISFYFSYSTTRESLEAKRIVPNSNCNYSIIAIPISPDGFYFLAIGTTSAEYGQNILWKGYYNKSADTMNWVSIVHSGYLADYTTSGTLTYSCKYNYCHCVLVTVGANGGGGSQFYIPNAYIVSVDNNGTIKTNTLFTNNSSVTLSVTYNSSSDSLTFSSTANKTRISAKPFMYGL